MSISVHSTPPLSVNVNDKNPPPTLTSALDIDPVFTKPKFCSACRKNVAPENFSHNRKICNKHSSQPVSPSAVVSPESALHQMRSMRFCQPIPHKTDQKKVLDIYIDYDALIRWLDQRKDTDPRVDRIRRIPKENDQDLLNDTNGQITLARRHATREARRVRDFIYIGTGLLFIHKTVAVGQKLQWTCQSRCSQSDRLKGGREGMRRHSDPKRPSTSRPRYPCQGTTTVSLLHQQPGQRRLLHLVIKHAFVHGPHDDRHRESGLSEDLPPATDFHAIDPALRSCLTDQSTLVGSTSAIVRSTIGFDDSTISKDIFVDHSLITGGDVEHSLRSPKEIHELLAEDEERNQLLKKLVFDHQLQIELHHAQSSVNFIMNEQQEDDLINQTEILRNFFKKRHQLMNELGPLIEAYDSQNNNDKSHFGENQNINIDMDEERSYPLHT